MIIVVPRNGRHTGTYLLVAEGKELVTAIPWYAISVECTYSFYDIVSSCSSFSSASLCLMERELYPNLC